MLKKLFFIICVTIFINLFSLVIFLLPNIFFYNLSFETGIVYSIFFIFICINIIFLLSYLIYLYVFDKSTYFNKQLSTKKNLVYAALYLLYCFIIDFIIVYFVSFLFYGYDL